MGRSYSEIAGHLNEAGFMTGRGKKFYPQTVKNYLKRMNGERFAITATET
jgi:hypothetical protein